MNTEEMMAKALEGKFFWEKTMQEEQRAPEACHAIRRAQQKFRPIRKDDPAIYNYDPNPDPEMLERISRLKKYVADEYGLQISDIDSKSTSKYTAHPKNFMMWAAVRYNPGTTLSRIARGLGRHYSTVIHGRDTFEVEKGLHVDLIAKFDELMNKPT